MFAKACCSDKRYDSFPVTKLGDCYIIENFDAKFSMNYMVDFPEEMFIDVTEYTEALARRLADMIIIFDEKILVKLKSGLQMEVEE